MAQFPEWTSYGTLDLLTVFYGPNLPGLLHHILVRRVIQFFIIDPIPVHLSSCPVPSGHSVVGPVLCPNSCRLQCSRRVKLYGKERLVSSMGWGTLNTPFCIQGIRTNAHAYSSRPTRVHWGYCPCFGRAPPALVYSAARAAFAASGNPAPDS